MGGEVTEAKERSRVYKEWGNFSGYMGVLVGAGGVVGRAYTRQPQQAGDMG